MNACGAPTPGACGGARMDPHASPRRGRPRNPAVVVKDLETFIDTLPGISGSLSIVDYVEGRRRCGPLQFPRRRALIAWVEGSSRRTTMVSDLATNHRPRAAGSSGYRGE